MPGSELDPQRPRLRREAPLPDMTRRIRAMASVLIVTVALLLMRSSFLENRAGSLSEQAEQAEQAASVPIQITGDVPAPGIYELSPPATVHSALRAAGAAPGAHVDATLPAGTRLVLSQGTLHLERMDELLVFSLPIDINSASAQALSSIPGVSDSLAQKIVEDRSSEGLFSSVDELQRVKGIGPATVEKLRPFVE